MDCQRAILSDALAFVSQHPLPELGSVEDYVSEELEDTLGSFNSRYYACSKHTNQYLEEYLNHNFDDFIELI